RRLKRASSVHLPFDKELPQFLLGTINERKIKEATHARTRLFERCRGKIGIKLNGRARRPPARCLESKGGLEHVYGVVRAPWCWRLARATAGWPLTRQSGAHPPACPAPGSH